MRGKHKYFTILIFAIVALSLSMPVLGYEGAVKVFVNNEAVDADVKLIDGTTYLPVRAISEALGAQVGWDGTTKTVNVDLDLQNKDEIVPAVIEEVSPWVVGIIGNLKDEYSTSSSYGEQIVHGTGIIIKEEGEILTNAHVVKVMDTIVVVLSNGEGYEGHLKCIDEETDLAVVEIGKAGLPVAQFAKQEDIVSGKTVIAIGTPISFSLRNSASLGIVSGVNRSIDSSYRLIQTDAAINPGNSGGPLVNINGKVMGINSSKFSGTGIEGMGFSIPISTIEYVINHFDQYGKVNRPYLGASFEEDWAAKIGLPTNAGLTITYIKTGSPAETYGLLEGDEVISIDGSKVSSTVDFNESMKNYLGGSEASFKIKRDGIIQDFKITLGSEL